MARKLSGVKRKAIIEAAITTIATDGSAAPTSHISKSAGVAEGTLFLYFETKAALLNAVFRRLRQEQASAI